MPAGIAASQPAVLPGFAIRPFVVAAIETLQRSPRYGIWWILTGRGTCRVDFREHVFGPDTLVFLTPYQPFRFQPIPTAADSAAQAGSVTVSGVLIEFTPDFFCIERHRAEAGCSST